MRVMTKQRQHALAFGGGSEWQVYIGGVRYNRQQDAADADMSSLMFALFYGAPFSHIQAEVLKHAAGE